MKKIKVGIIQQSNTADIRVNLMNLAKSIEACAAHGAQLIVLQELHNSLYFCQTENTSPYGTLPSILENWNKRNASQFWFYHYSNTKINPNTSHPEDIKIQICMWQDGQNQMSLGIYTLRKQGTSIDLLEWKVPNAAIKG